ncbi:alpha/beta hydrolase [Synoicihabitans lomoniglobus]|uniref:Alpha/beta hydrolase fold domain-containing protein n=1 Tax=Synoicihabitans lomoniglobus TaxID=2909285 RepID=A0AAF0CPX8_9BACT|nr:alpha/beta hydrolase fold domain-containing protein [Opitutaceae bacterium LMO-M01]WED65890.1 alpha/beta hydrolase fold domain-containing protein [Opitutaceae bacterium LMO-M01]
MSIVTGLLADHHYAFQPAADASAPPLLLLHGTGGGEHDLISLGAKLSPGSALLSPRGNISERGAARFFRRFAEGVFDLDDVRARTDALAEFVRIAAQTHQIDLSRLIAIGFSNGANIAATIMQRQPDVLTGGILLRAMVVLDAPAAPGTLTGKRVLLASGDHDPLMTADDPRRLARHLRSGGAEVDHHVHDAGHGLVDADFSVSQSFLQRLP